MSVTAKGQLSTRNSVLMLLTVLALVLSVVALVPALVADAKAVTVTPAPNESCEGVFPTPGSENTDKQLTSGGLDPGGTATFLISFPVDADDVNTEFRITDCVTIDGEVSQKFFVNFVPNIENYILTFEVTIPADTPIGAEFCNFAKTTQSPSESQASNRKAGPACFIVGGALRVLKVDQDDAPLAGAEFTVACTWPDVNEGTSLPATIINAPTNGSINGSGSSLSIPSVDGGSLSATVITGDEGVISVNGPQGTVCTFTEESAPDGYDADTTTECVLTISHEQEECTFANTLQAPPSEAPPSEVAESEIPAESEREDTLGGTPTPGASVPNTALWTTSQGTMPATLLGIVALLAMSVLVYLRTAVNRRR